MVETVYPQITIPEAQQEARISYAAFIDQEEFQTLPIEERFNLILNSHKGNRLAELLMPQEVVVIREYLGISDQELAVDVEVSGDSYAGKSLLADFGAQIAETEHWDGKEIFDRREKDAAESGKEERSPEEHMDFDEFQRQEFARSKSTGIKKFKQARLAGINLAEARDQREAEILARNVKIAKFRQRGFRGPKPIEEIKAISFLAVASDKARLDRAHTVAKRIAKENGLPVSEWPTRNQVEKAMWQRDKESLKKWRPGHPFYLANGKLPFDPDLERPNGMPVYDFIVFTTKKSPLEAAIYMLQKVKQARGFRQKNDLIRNEIKGLEERDLTGGDVFVSPDIEEARLLLGTDRPRTIAEVQALEIQLMGEPISDQHSLHPSRTRRNQSSTRKKVINQNRESVA